MNRRMFIGIMTGALTVAVRVAIAQQSGGNYRIGFLGSPSAAEFATRVDAMRAGLRDLGYVEGQNLVIEFRWANDDLDRLPGLAAELVHLKVDILVTHGLAGTLAAKRATTSIPIVMAIAADAIASGLVTSIARPSGNITGTTIFIPEISAKRLELLKAAVPHTTRAAVLMRRDSLYGGPILKPMEGTARAMNVTLQFFEVRAPTELERAFSSMASARVDGVVVSEEPTLIANSKVIAELAAKYRLPSTGFGDLADAGGLIGYGVDALEIFRHAAVFVDKILKGAKPGELPIEQATKFRLLVNLRTAKALGLTIPQDLLLRADEVIQ